MVSKLAYEYVQLLVLTHMYPPMAAMNKLDCLYTARIRVPAKFMDWVLSLSHDTVAIVDRLDQ